MSRKKVYLVEKQERYRMLNEFYKMVSAIKTPKEASNFFQDLLTPSESLMLTRRIEIAKMLLEGFSYVEIEEKLKAGSNTINSVNRWLFTGFGGYLREVKKAGNRREMSQVLPTTEWGQIKKKYPAHFMIFNLVDKLKNKK